MQIHATNVKGLGAIQVVKSFLDAWENREDILGTRVFLPESGDLSFYSSKKSEIVLFKRYLPSAISRVFECYFAKAYFRNELTIVLGDIPLRGISEQVVLVHHPYIAYPKVNEFSSRSLKARLMRLIFRSNLKYAKRILVQTAAMGSDLIKSYPEIQDRLIICPQPPPNWLQKASRKSDKRSTDLISLFYPATYSPYKNHDFLEKINSYAISKKRDLTGIEIKLTLNEAEFEKYQCISFVKNLGRLSPAQMNLEYQKTDALIFLSSLETYGLPLVEALTLELPILTADFDYSRWICGDEGYYFKHGNEESFFKALNKLIEDLRSDKVYDYRSLLEKFPKSWDSVVDVYYNELTRK